MADPRETIAQRLAELNRSESWLSNALGKNRAYVQQYLKRGTPRELPLDIRLQIARLLNMHPEDLNIPTTLIENVTPAAEPMGMAEDAEPFEPPADHYLRTGEHISYLKAKTNALDRHKLQIRKGDVIAFDFSPLRISSVAAGDAVVVQIYDGQTDTAQTVLRQYVPPSLLVTNSTGKNSLIDMEDGTQPFEAIIKGVIVSTIRPSNGSI